MCNVGDHQIFIKNKRTKKTFCTFPPGSDVKHVTGMLTCRAAASLFIKSDFNNARLSLAKGARGGECTKKKRHDSDLYGCHRCSLAWKVIPVT